MNYNAKEMEQKWQKEWEKNKLYQTKEDNQKPKFYCLEQFPYPSGNLHMGHMRVYSLGDVIARYKRMNGYNVLHPMGWDSFGLPAENAAIKSGVHPAKWTYENIDFMRNQLKTIGVSYDWEKEVTTCSPEYYKFNQWLFLLFYEKGLAYRKKAPVNWCNSCHTVLANEQVKDEKCWRCDNQVVKKELDQWFFKISEYSEQLLAELDQLDGWNDKVKAMQKNWIGKSVGTNIEFCIKDSNEKLTVFTTRPDTIHGITYITLAAEHPMVEKILENHSNKEKIKSFVENIKNKDDRERTSTKTEKEGMFTGNYAIHPITGKEIPIWISNYVLMNVGTGAVMGVPAHDKRDEEFAKKYDLSIEQVIDEQGKLIHSEKWDGLSIEEAQKEINHYLSEHEIGGKTTTYRLRDWLVSRQRYWGTPIPIIYCDQCGIVPEKKENLPLVLPSDVTFDKGVNPLETSETFVHTTCPMCGSQAKRETDTMDTFVDSSWYYLRYTDNQNEEIPFSAEKANQWMEVDEYVGGIEHAILHLLYSRFFTKVLYDEGMVKTKEPFKKLLAQGMVLKDGKKMSKSLGNVISPSEIIDEYGADTCRLFILSAAPPEQDIDWKDSEVKGSYLFLQDLYDLVATSINGEVIKDETKQTKEFRRVIHQTIKKVTEAIEKRKFNTVQSFIRILQNKAEELNIDKHHEVFSEATDAIILLLSPFVPHLTEELWSMKGHTTSVHEETWTSWDEQLLVEEVIELPVQVNGKVRGKIEVTQQENEKSIKEKALAAVEHVTKDQQVKQIRVIPKKIISIVI